jgi:hypothetical protein
MLMAKPLSLDVLLHRCVLTQACQMPAVPAACNIIDASTTAIAAALDEVLLCCQLCSSNVCLKEQQA